jgi:hypothetical protein
LRPEQTENAPVGEEMSINKEERHDDGDRRVGENHLCHRLAKRPCNEGADRPVAGAQIERLDVFPDLKSRMHQHLMETHTQQERIDRILGSMGENRQLSSVTERTVARSTAKSAA